MERINSLYVHLSTLEEKNINIKETQHRFGFELPPTFLDGIKREVFKSISSFVSSVSTTIACVEGMTSVSHFNADLKDSLITPLVDAWASCSTADEFRQRVCELRRTICTPYHAALKSLLLRQRRALKMLQNISEAKRRDLPEEKLRNLVVNLLCRQEQDLAALATACPDCLLRFANEQRVSIRSLFQFLHPIGLSGGAASEWLDEAEVGIRNWIQSFPSFLQHQFVDTMCRSMLLMASLPFDDDRFADLDVFTSRSSDNLNLSIRSPSILHIVSPTPVFMCRRISNACPLVFDEDDHRQLSNHLDVAILPNRIFKAIDSHIEMNTLIPSVVSVDLFRSALDRWRVSLCVETPTRCPTPLPLPPPPPPTPTPPPHPPSIPTATCVVPLSLARDHQVLSAIAKEVELATYEFRASMPTFPIPIYFERIAARISASADDNASTKSISHRIKAVLDRLSKHSSVSQFEIFKPDVAWKHAPYSRPLKTCLLVVRAESEQLAAACQSVLASMQRDPDFESRWLTRRSAGRARKSVLAATRPS